LLNDLERSGYGAKVMSVSCGNPAFADDVSLLALTPFHLQKMVDSVFQFCKHWSVSINVAKSSVTVFTKSRSQPIANIVYGDCPIIQTESYVHLGILYSYNPKYKDKISQRLQKAKNALFSLSAQGVHAQGVNPLVSVDLYSKVVIPIALYGSELWNNLTQTNISAISGFQHYAA